LDKKDRYKSLFENFQNGNKKAFDLIFYENYELLCNFAALFLKDSSKAEELVADVFLNLWKKKDQIVIISSFKAYLYRSTRNAAFSELRKEKGKWVKSDDEIEFQNTELSPESLMIRKEIHESFQELIDQMPKQAALVFRLHKVDGMNYREIAELLDLSVKTVENHMGRALKAIREMYLQNPDVFSE